MKKARFTEEQIVRIVQEARAEPVPAVARKHGVSEQTLYNWRNRFGGMPPSQVAELKRLAQENARLKRLVADRDLEIEVMKEIAAKSGERAGAPAGGPAGLGPRRPAAPCLLAPVGVALDARLPPPDARARRTAQAGTGSGGRRAAGVGLPAGRRDIARTRSSGERQAGASRVAECRAQRAPTQTPQAAYRGAPETPARDGERGVVHGFRRGPDRERPQVLDTARQGRGQRLLRGGAGVGVVQGDGCRACPHAGHGARYGRPAYLRCDNGGQFISKAVRLWAERKRVGSPYIDPGSPWQNGAAGESLVATFRRKVLDAELFHSLLEAHVLSERWRRLYNERRPHSRLDYRPPITAYLPAQGHRLAS